jgi:hypothetical protein
VGGSAAIDTVVFTSSHDRPDIRIEEVDAGEVARRMAASLVHERHGLLESYRQFRFAFPDRHSPAVDGAADLEGRLLAQALAGRRVWWLRHPYPCDIQALFSPIAALPADKRP